ncbi:AAA family ATPase [Gynuella sp.]|uniref:AAA family ATPase n=1 Tax=Gynuella sp. TaxID=2969146 RepID=UPI003D11C10E
MNKGCAYLLTGKVASGKTTYARKMEAEKKAVFLSIDELQLSIFGSSPTREQLDNSYEGARAYQFKEALKFLENGIDVLFDWGLWKKTERQKYKEELQKHGFEVVIIYFKVSDEVRLEWNSKRNSGSDETSFKIESHDVALFDSMYEEPTDEEYNRLVTY